MIVENKQYTIHSARTASPNLVDTLSAKAQTPKEPTHLRIRRCMSAKTMSHRQAAEELLRGIDEIQLRDNLLLTSSYIAIEEALRTKKDLSKKKYEAHLHALYESLINYHKSQAN